MLNPIFHPYYIEYGFDKTEFFLRLYVCHRRLWCYLSIQVSSTTFFLKTLEWIFLTFGTGIATLIPRSSYSRQFGRREESHIMRELAFFEMDFVDQYAGVPI